VFDSLVELDKDLKSWYSQLPFLTSGILLDLKDTVAHYFKIAKFLLCVIENAAPQTQYRASFILTTLTALTTTAFTS